jgi:hypothetical protein
MKKIVGCLAFCLFAAALIAAQDNTEAKPDPLKIEISQDTTEKGTVTLAYIHATGEARVAYSAPNGNYVLYDGAFDADSYFWDAITTIRAKAVSFIRETKGDSDDQRYYSFHFRTPETTKYDSKNNQTSYIAFIRFYK